jgi:hypothetical protein
MAEWSELRTEFESLREALRFYRLDYQWGSAGTYYRLAGGGSSHATRRFELLSDIAGRKLLELPAETIGEAVLQAPDAISRWYEVLRHNAGAFEFGLVGTQTNYAGTNLGNIYTGTLSLPAESSALVCLQFSIVPAVATAAAENENTTLALVNRFLSREAEKRGYLWLVIGFIFTAALAMLSL